MKTIYALDILCKYKNRYRYFHRGFDPVYITFLSKENLLRKKHKSNTGEYGISKDKKGKYQLYLKHEYIGQFKTLQEAIERRENILNGIEY